MGERKSSQGETLPSNEEIAQAASVLARLQPGFLPKEIFEQYTRLCTTPIVELVPLRQSTAGVEVLLLKRPADDPVWPNMLHTPGTVLRSTDVAGGLELALRRIYESELQITPQREPVFSGTIFHQVDRGAELASVYWLDLTDQTVEAGTWYSLSDLPDNLVASQLEFIKNSANAFSKQLG
jgi:hypothetical protein